VWGLGVSLAVVTLAGAVAIENFSFVNTTWGGGLSGSPVPEPKLSGLDLGPNARSAASTGRAELSGADLAGLPPHERAATSSGRLQNPGV
jgi:hypothetical protein